MPGAWDIEVTQATNGLEALAAYRAGKVDVMFLDLTMPEMDGFQVLETLRQEDLNCLVIVVSADIQPQAQQRVLGQGAIAASAETQRGGGAHHRRAPAVHRHAAL